MTDPSPSPTVLDGLPVVVCDAFGTAEFVSPAAASLVGLDDGAAVSTLDELVHPSDGHAVAAAFVDAPPPGDGKTVTFRPRGGPEDRRLAATLTVPRYDDPPYVLYLRDVTDERRLCDAVRSLVHPTDGIATADSRNAVVGRVLERIDTLPSVDAGFYLLDEERATLRPIPSTADTPTDVPDPIVEAARTGEITPVDGGAFPLASDDAVEGAAIPLGYHGVLVVGVSPPRHATPALLDALSVVAAAVTFAFDRLAGRGANRRLRDALERSGAALDRLESVVRVVRRAERRAMDADSAAAVHRAVCEGLVALDPIAFVRYDTLDGDGGEPVPAASAGGSGFSPDDAGFESAPDAPPLSRAVARRDAVSIPDVATGFESADWRREALANGFRSVLAVPVTVRGTLCGVVSVYGHEAGALGGAVHAGVSHLAGTVGYVLQALQLRSVALDATAVELVLSIPDAETPLARVAAEANTVVRFESATSMRGSSPRVYFTADVPPDDVLAAADRTGEVGEMTASGRRGDMWLYEAAVAGRPVPATLASLGAILVAVRSDAGGTRATVALPRSADVRSFVDSVREVYPGTELLVRRTRERPVEAGRDFREEANNRLTDRQREVLSVAYSGGYFEWPRDRSGSDLAADLDIAQPTFARHLRTAERKLLELLFEDGD